MDTFHPAVVHFAIVLPLVALTLQFLYMRTKKSCYSTAALITLLFTTVFVVISWLTGKADAKDVFESLMTYTENGADLLKSHGSMGLYLMIAIAVITITKVATLKFKQPVLEIVVLIMLVIAAPAMMLQGKSGGEIVYKNGSLFDYPDDEDEEE